MSVFTVCLCLYGEVCVLSLRMCIRGICKYSNTHFPVEKHIYVYIYSIYIGSVSFAYNMQTATW